MHRFSLAVLLMVLPGCSAKVIWDSGLVGETGLNPDETGDTATETGDTAPVDTGPSEEELDAIWGESRLVITSPKSGDFLPFGEPASFEAHVEDVDGEIMDFDEIQWSSDIDGSWTPVGQAFEDELSVGTHALTAMAELPNGDRLAYTVGGVLVQAEDTGIYTGTVSIDVTVEYDGTPYTVTCIGATTITIDQAGELATGESSCTISLFGYDTDAAQDIELALDDGDLSGEVALDLSFLSYGFDATGTVSDGALSATWTDDVYGYATVEGTLEATRVSRYLESD